MISVMHFSSIYDIYDEQDEQLFIEFLCASGKWYCVSSV